MKFVCSKELVDKVCEIYDHIRKAKEELEQMNIGNVHNELNHLLTNGIVMVEDEGIDMNDTVTCILTKEGAEILNDVYSGMNEHFPNGHKMKCDYQEGDTYENQLWSIISYFQPFRIGQDVYVKNIKKIVK